MRKSLAALIPLLLSTSAAFAQDCSTATPAPSYADKVLGESSGHLVAYWKLDETTGTVAADSSGNGYDAEYAAPSLAATTFLDGSNAPTFDGIDDLVNLYSSSFAAAYPAGEGSVMLWENTDTGTLSDGISHYLLGIRSGAGAEFDLIKTGGGAFAAGYQNQFLTTSSIDGWNHWLVSWSESADEVVFYLNGISVGSGSPIDAWAGSLSSSFAVVGSNATFTMAVFPGSIAQVAFWDVPLDSSQAADLATVDSTVPTVVPTCAPTPTPNVFTYVTLPAPDISGTPQPGQAAAIKYEVTGGQFMIALVVLGLLLCAVFDVTLRLRGR